MRFVVLTFLAVFVARPVTLGFAEESPQFERDVVPLLKRHCVKCHGPAKQEAELNLAVPASLVRGGKTGSVIVPHDADASLLWQRVAADEMPPKSPLSDGEKSILRRWIADGTLGLKPDSTSTDSQHWAFRAFAKKPSVELLPKDSNACRLALDGFIVRELSRDKLTLLPEADRATLIRRVTFDLTGLPPTPEAITEFIGDTSVDAFERMLDRYLASPHYGERLGKVWLDAAGYADSNGYFNADSDRPLAYRYRDYVIRAWNSDKPFNQFIREQIAGDEIAGFATRNGETVQFASESSSRLIELLEATHYLRCGQDGSGESDGNPDEVRVDRYTVIETAMQNVSTGLLGLTVQCAKCHDHKFEPLTQRDYYSFQAVLIPAFPPEQWVKPNDRFVYASPQEDFTRWQSDLARAEADVARLEKEIAEWVRQNRPRGTIVFSDDFEGEPESMTVNWSSTVPGDDTPAGTAAVTLNSREAPAAVIAGGRLELIEGGPGGDKCLSTNKAFDWTPDTVGASIQATFDLVANHVGQSNAAERIGYFVALHDFNDSSEKQGGNILVDGHPSSSTAVYVDYPGVDSKHVGNIGTTGYAPGRNYGMRITNKGDGKFLVEHLVDWLSEEKTITLAESDLSDGGFGFEFCCGRSFVVDNVVIETFAPTDPGNPLGEFLAQLKSKRQPLDDAQKRKTTLSATRPGKIAWTTDVAEPPPAVHVLLRGNYNTPGEIVQAGGFGFLNQQKPAEKMKPDAEMTGPQTDQQSSNEHPRPRGSGRRLAFANWLTEPQSTRAALLSRVHVNRLWQHHFGTGIVATPDNFGLSGSPPSHPDVLESLAMEFVERGWSSKYVSRLIVSSAAYRQISAADQTRLTVDPVGRRLSRFPIRRLDAEAVRDMLLVASGELDDRLYGPYVATTRTDTGETIIPEDNPSSRRRSIYVQQKRTQVHSLLQVFDAPSIVFNSTRRPRSTMPLQSLSLLNSEFSVARAKNLAKLLQQDFSSDSDKIEGLFLATTSHAATDDEIAASTRFLDAQQNAYQGDADARARAWTDLSQLLLISNAALYLE